MIGLFNSPQTSRKHNGKGMWLGCEQPFLLGGALRDGPKNGCEGDYIFGRCLGNLRAKFQGNPLNSDALEDEVSFCRLSRLCCAICQHCGYRGCRQPIEMHETPAESQGALRRIIFCGKLVQCATVNIITRVLC